MTRATILPFPLAAQGVWKAYCNKMLQPSRMILPPLRKALAKEKTMHRFALPIRLAILAGCIGLAGCAGLEAQQGSAPWEQGSKQFQECLRYASVSYCRDDIYGHGG